MNMKYKTKFLVSNHGKLELNIPGKYWYHIIGTVQLILGHCPFLSLCSNWPCVMNIFSFVRFLYWLIYWKSCSKKRLYFQLHAGCQVIYFFAVLVEEPRLLPNSSWSYMKMCLKYLNHFSNTARFFHWL